MRSPVLLGALAALAVGAVTLLLVLNTVMSEPPRAPTPGAPTPPPIAVLTPTPLETPVPTATGGPPASPGPSPTGEPVEPPDDGLGLGDQAIPIRLPALGGGTLDTSEYAGTPLWINFMATWCPQCVDELPMMELMQDQLGESMRIVLVDVGEDEEIVEDFISSLEVTLPVGIDRDSQAMAEWGVNVLPMHVWVDEENVIRSIVFGGAPREIFVESVLNVVPDAELE